MVVRTVTSSKRAYATNCMTQVCCSQSPWPHGWPLLTQASAGDTQTLKGRLGSVSVGSLGLGVHKTLFEPSEHLWWVWGLILNMIYRSYPLVGASSLPLDMGHSHQGLLFSNGKKWAFSTLNTWWYCNTIILSENKSVSKGYWLHTLWFHLYNTFKMTKSKRWKTEW